MKTITRENAAKLGKDRYYTGKLCVRKHDSQRYVRSGACCECIAHYSRKYAKPRKSAVTKDMKRLEFVIHKDMEPILRAFVEAFIKSGEKT